MDINKFIETYTTLPKKFIDDFYMLCNSQYSTNSIVINFEPVYKWLQYKKGDLKRVIISNFVLDVDYTINIIDIKSHKEEILLSSDCVKELCMITKSKNCTIIFYRNRKIS
jgi:uncharacterized protein (DUF362 family)